MNETLRDQAIESLRQTARIALEHDEQQPAVVLHDQEFELTRILLEAYHEVLPNAQFIEVPGKTVEDIRALLNTLAPKTLVVLLQSTNFRLNEFRFRLELFQRELKTIEHLHLNRLSEDQFGTYIASLAYDPQYFRPLGHALKERLDKAQCVEVVGEGTSLVYDGPMEEAKLNVGDYSGMKNIGGTYPIGEVFTEPKDLTRVNGTVNVFSFAGDDHCVQLHKPFTLVIQEGVVVDVIGAPESFVKILEAIRAQERCLVREFGLGLNPALTKTQIVNDITAYERMTGLHLSLGEKHGVYKKPGLVPGETRYHVDVFGDVERILVDNEAIFEKDHYMVV